MPARQPRALFGNAAFEVVAGSELVILEIAEELVRRGWACDITAWAFGDPMQRMASEAGIGVLPRVVDVRPLTYDLVWLQNRLEPVMNYGRSADDAPRTLFAFAHLDSKWHFAQPGVIAERLLGQLFVVTSERAVERVVRRGLPEEAVRMFRNAAPAGYDMPPPPARDRPRTAFIVSNHAPPEVLDAAALLRRAGVAVEHWGLGGDVIGQRLLPQELARADMVITIGKTVPYALLARRPAYVYDHFGGPGWLRDANLAATAERNFSGLCTERRIDGAAIAQEVLAGFADAAGEAAGRSDAALAPFRLEAFLDEVMAMVAAAPSPATHRRRMAPQEVALMAERSLAHAAGQHFAIARRAQRRAGMRADR